MAKRNQKNEIESLNPVDLIRKRPAMYIGGTDAFGFIQYIVCAIHFICEHKASLVEIEISDRISVRSDASFTLTVNSKNQLMPFEAYRDERLQKDIDATILNALSEDFESQCSDGKIVTKYVSKRGQRISYEERLAEKKDVWTNFKFFPDSSIFNVIDVSPLILHSYFRRLSCLIPGASFRIKKDGEVIEYKSETGVREFFDGIVAPFQILNEPIEMHGADGDLTVDLVFALQSWSKDHIWSFANNGRIVDGGSHEKGVKRAIKKFRKAVGNDSQNGILMVLIVNCPEIKYGGCVRTKVDDPELEKRVYKLTDAFLTNWTEENPIEKGYFGEIERFQSIGLR